MNKSHNVHTGLADEEIIARHNRREQLVVPAPTGAKTGDDVHVTGRGGAFLGQVTGVGPTGESMSVRITG